MPSAFCCAELWQGLTSMICMWVQDGEWLFMKQRDERRAKQLIESCNKIVSLASHKHSQKQVFVYINVWGMAVLYLNALFTCKQSYVQQQQQQQLLFVIPNFLLFKIFQSSKQTEQVMLCNPYHTHRVTSVANSHSERILNNIYKPKLVQMIQLITRAVQRGLIPKWWTS